MRLPARDQNSRSALWIGCFLLCWNAAFNLAHAAPATPEKLTQIAAELRDKANRIVTDPDRMDFAQWVLDSYLDTPRMAHQALPKSWDALTPQQRARYQAAFAQYLKNYVVQAIIKYPQFKLDAIDVLASSKTAYLMTRFLLPEHTPVKFSLRLYKTATDWKVEDLQVGGLSLTGSLRQQFEEIFARHGFDGLMEKLTQVYP